ncbi:hypothetical protein C2G38_2233817 [Gigaspora rosea]|uniref:Uncharacterized protein n=1 Tax=Gigaspora rosea TaxID=44941 RepID=A0A397TW34_9GLOM|nr:hypothetical protein C2G38_2233817 [Gigaspora rosea]
MSWMWTKSVIEKKDSKTFDYEVPKFFNSLDKPDLQEIKFNIQDKNYVIDYNKYDKENNDRSLDPFLEVIDRGPISHYAYRKLAAIQPELPQAYEILDTGKRINQEMSTNIPIFILNIENISFKTSNVNEDTSNQEVEEEVLKYIRKACYRCIIDILLYILPGLVDRNVLNTNNPVINIRISSDGHNVGRTIKHMIITCTILDDILNIHKADFHYTLILYPGVENYDILKKVMKPFIVELNNLTTNELVDSNGIKWRVEPYFSSNWKFMAIILGFNAPNSKNFCPWCLCTKKDIGNKDNIYKLRKILYLLKSDLPPPSHLKPPLLPMIRLDWYVPDELHIMLRIWDHL